MNFWKLFLSLTGWKTKITVPFRNKCIICVAPHTSNWDFPVGLFAYRSLGRKANFLMKKFWFFFPLKYLLSSLGGIPVDRKNPSVSLTELLIEKFYQSTKLNLAITPEGTRKGTTKWKTGFLYISYGANVPIQLGVIDYQNKTVIIEEEYIPTGDIEKDISFIRNYYSKYKAAAKYPQKFLI